MNSYTKSQGDAFFLLQPLMQVAHGIENTEPSTDGSLRIVFMRLGIPKVDQETITQELGDMSIKTCDNLGADLLIDTDHVTPVFRVELGRQFGGIDQVAEHHRELATFRFGGTRGHDRRGCCDRWGGLGRSRWDRLERLRWCFSGPFDISRFHRI